jgi:hypothetical protein
MRSPITCCLSSPLNPLMLRLIRVSSCSSSSWLTSLFCLRYREFDSHGFPSFCRSEEFDSCCPPYFCWCEVSTSFISVSPVLVPPSIPSSFPRPTSFGGCVCSFCAPFFDPRLFLFRFLLFFRCSARVVSVGVLHLCCCVLAVWGKFVWVIVAGAICIPPNVTVFLAYITGQAHERSISCVVHC